MWLRVSLQPTAATGGSVGITRVNVNPVGFETVLDDTRETSQRRIRYDFRAATTVDDSSGALTYSWRKVSTKKAKGGSYYLEHRKNAKASWSFNGRSVSWLAVTGPAFGKADVFVDGVRKATFNNYASRIKFGVAAHRQGPELRASTPSRSWHLAKRAPRQARAPSWASTASRWARR